MTDPRLLRLGTPHAFDRALLESARDDHAPDGAEARALAALGIGAVATVVVAHGAGAAPAATAVSKVATAGILKWIGLGLAVGVVAAGPLAYLVESTERSFPVAPSPQEPASSVPVMPIASQDRMPPVAEPMGTEVVVSPPPARPAAVPSAIGSAAAPPSSSVEHSRSADTLSAEVDLLDRARAALAARDPAGARRVLQQYEARYPGGVLREEADLASIEMLVAEGSTADANQAALRFLAEHPGSALGGRVRAIAKRTSNP